MLEKSVNFNLTLTLSYDLEDSDMQIVHFGREN